MLPETIGAEIAKRSYAALSSHGLKSAHYPAPGYLPVLPTLVVLWDRIDVSESNEQIDLLRYRGLLFTSMDPIESQISSIDPMVMPLIDAFSPNLNRDNYHLFMTDGDRVDFCRVSAAELSVPITYNNEQHYGGRVWWDVKLRRHAGGT